MIRPNKKMMDVINNIRTNGRKDVQMDNWLGGVKSSVSEVIYLIIHQTKAYIKYLDEKKERYL